MANLVSTLGLASARIYAAFGSKEDLFREAVGLMAKELGYSRYGAHGGDWGSTMSEHLARSHASSVIGIHLTDVPFGHTRTRAISRGSRCERAFSSDLTRREMTVEC
jgi:hypothetical protein